MDRTNALGEFLRARRELVRPADVGISAGGGLRRVPGLRREEVAMLAGISSDYYLRLEQGRDRNPSVQILDALAKVLRLDADASAYMIGLTRERSSPQRRSPQQTPRRPAPPAPEEVPRSIRQLIESWTNNPAYVQNKVSDILAVNALAAALSPNYAPGVNLLRAAFLDAADKDLRRDWEEATAEGVASLRAHVGPDVDDPRLVELVGELSVKSERFRRLWGRHDVQPKKGRVSRLSHPQVGEMDLQSDKLGIGGTDGLILVVFHAEPGSRSAESLNILGSLAASADHTTPTRQPPATSPPADMPPADSRRED